MTVAQIKALSFISFIVIGVLLKKKFSSKEEINGLKKIILLLALPATIFIALLKVNLNTELLLLPVWAFLFNVFLYGITPGLLNLIGIKDHAIRNTARLLIPSLAPGLSCFPFILEFLGSSYLAKAAMADLGNKFFVLFILYILAMSWHYKKQSTKPEPVKSKLKSLAKVMLFEPVNLIIILALILVGLGLHMSNLPLFVQDNLLRLSTIMTPLVLVFIGLAVVFKKKLFTQVFSLLMLKYGVTLLGVSALVSIVSFKDETDILLLLAFGLSACSFWPFAHISSFASREIDVIETHKTFNPDFALAVLALSLPLSVLLVLGVLTSGHTFTSSLHILILGVLVLSIGLILPGYNAIKKLKELKKTDQKPFNFKSVFQSIFHL